MEAGWLLAKVPNANGGAHQQFTISAAGAIWTSQDRQRVCKDLYCIKLPWVKTINLINMINMNNTLNNNTTGDN